MRYEYFECIECDSDDFSICSLRMSTSIRVNFSLGLSFEYATSTNECDEYEYDVQFDVRVRRTVRMSTLYDSSEYVVLFESRVCSYATSDGGRRVDERRHTWRTIPSASNSGKPIFSASAAILMSSNIKKSSMAAAAVAIDSASGALMCDRVHDERRVVR